MTISTADRTKIISGISWMWFTDMANVTLEPFDTADTPLTSALATSQVLKYLHTEEGRSEYVSQPILSEKGLMYNLQVNAANLVMDAEKDKAFNEMMRKRWMLFFKDNHGNYRFILNARLALKINTGMFKGGEPVYNITWGAQSQHPAFYYSGLPTILSDRSLAL